MQFRFLDCNEQGYITIKEIKKMIDGIAYLWNWLTGGKVNPT